MRGLLLCSPLKRLAEEFHSSYQEEAYEGKYDGGAIVHVYLLGGNLFESLGGEIGELGFLDGHHVAPRPYFDKRAYDETRHNEKGLLVESAQ